MTQDMVPDPDTGHITADRPVIRLWMIPVITLLILVATGWWTHHLLERSVKTTLAEELSTILEANVTALDLWIESQKSVVEVHSHQPKARSLIASLIDLAHRTDYDAATLLASQPLSDLRAHFEPTCRAYGYVGFVIMDTTGRNVGALLDEPVGQRSAADGSDFVQRTLTGEVLISTVLPGEVGLPDESGAFKIGRPTMFVAAPVHDDKGTVIGVLSFRIRPGADFTRILSMARMGDTGETYAFDHHGTLLSDSRFDGHLKSIGLLADHPDSHPILNVSVRDPGGDMVGGFSPTGDRGSWPLTRMAEEAINGRDGVDVEGYRDYRGITVVGAWKWLDRHRLGVTTEMDLSEAYQPLVLLHAVFVVLLGLLAASSAGLFLLDRQNQKWATRLQVHAQVLSEKNQQWQKARDDTEASARAKTEFLANMSHEIRTPMTAILGYTDMLAEDLGDAQDSLQKRDAIHTIQRNGRHLLTLINDILDLSKIEADKMTTEKVPCSPLEIAQEVISLFRPRTAEKRLALNLEVSGLVPQTILSDPTRLRQILVNIVSNGIKFTADGGVRIIVKMADHADAPRPRLRFDVIDTGLGISPEQIDVLFQPFSQADASTTRQYGGTGLGLSISKRLAMKLGGDITVASTYGEGACFSVTIETGPLEGVEMTDLADDLTTAAPHTDGARTTRLIPGCDVLLAEDGPDNQRLLNMVLRKAGADVTIAGDGQIAYDQAMKKWRAGKPFDVILMDMQMPRLDGYEATRKLRADGYTGPIIAITAHAMANDRDKCIAAGCDEYQTKPINRNSLIAEIKKIIPCENPSPEAQLPETNLKDAHTPDASPGPHAAQASIRAIAGKVAAIQQCIIDSDRQALLTMADQLANDADAHGIGLIVDLAKQLRDTARTTHDLSILDSLVRQLATQCNSAHRVEST
jgi:signal transduction histidine kinase/DNA-binding NarL/FixJ family response regulator